MGKPTANPTKAVAAPVENRQDRLLHSSLSAAFAAMLVATPLLPSDTYSLAVDGQIAAPAMLWLMLAICACAAWILQTLQGRMPRIGFSYCDALVGIFFFWTAVSGAISTSNADRRAGWNMMASWVSLGMTYFLARLLLRETVQLRAIVAGILVVALMFAAEGIYEAWIVIPENQARFRQNPAAVFAEAGIDVQRNSLAYEQFRSRLETQSPSATFALENSFAGYLLPALILTVGLLVWRRAPSDDQRHLLRFVGLSVSLVVLSYCIFLTHSTAAVVAAGVSLLMGAVAILFRDQSAVSRIMRYGSAVALFLVFLWPILTAFSGQEFANRLPLTLRYRAEYWQSCATMIAKVPLLGCGPGNFQDAYARVMLPQAAETIADPHNLIWEVLCTGGIFAGLLFVVALVCAARFPLRQLLLGPSEQQNQVEGLTESPTSLRFLAFGALAGVPLALLLSLSSGSSFLLIFLRSWLLIGIVPAAALVFALSSWVRRGDLSVSLIWLAWLALAIHLTVSGGISNPGTGTLFFLLLANTQTVKVPDVQSSPSRESNAGFVILPVLGAFAAAHYFWGYVPVLAAQAALQRAETALSASNINAGKSALEEAAKADPWSSAPYGRLALLEFQDYAQAARGESRTDPSSLIEAARIAVTHSKTSPTIHYEMALTLLRAHAIAPQPELISEATELLLKTTELAPSKAVAWAYLAFAQAKAGALADASKSARQALRLDALNPHEQYDLDREPSPIPGRTFPGWLRELADQGDSK